MLQVPRCPKPHHPPILSPSPRLGDASFLQSDRPGLPGRAVREGRAAGGIRAPQRVGVPDAEGRVTASRCCVVDILRDLHPLTPGFTWESPDRARASRIDLIGCPSVWAPFVSCCDIVPCPFSDHAAVHLSICPPVPIPRGPGRWKCDVSVLDDPDLRTKVESFWLQWRPKQPFFPSVGKWWDKGKTLIKALISQHCSAKALKKRQERDLLNRLASDLKVKLDAVCGGTRPAQHCGHEQNCR